MNSNVTFVGLKAPTRTVRIIAARITAMIDKYRLEELRRDSGEKGDLARWVIQLQKDLDDERRKATALEFGCAAPQVTSVPEIGEIRVGRLPTMNQDEYPGLGDWWVQLRIGDDFDEVLARVYGATPQETNTRAVALANRAATAAPAVQAEQQEPVSHPYTLPPHVYRELVNSLRDTAVKYRDSQQLRAKISRTLSTAIAPAHGGNSPVIPDGWIPVSERLPETDGNYWGWWSESKRQGPVWFIKSEIQAQFQSSEITHWMPLPAAPQQEALEVKK